MLTLCGAVASAATYTWTGAGDGVSFSDAANWTPGGGPPTSGDTVILTDGVATTTSITLGADVAIETLTFDNVVNALALSGAGKYTLEAAGGTGITVTTTGNDNTIDNNIDLGASQTWDIASGRLLVHNGVLGQASAGLSLTKAGAGTLVLNGANTFTGGISINAGTVSVGADASLGGSSATVTLNGGVLQTTNTFTLSGTRGISVSAASAIDVAATTTLTQGGAITGAADLTKSGAGTFALTADNSSFSGKWNVTGGSLDIDGTVSGTADSRLGAAPGGATVDAITLNGGTLRVTNGTNAITANRGITLGASGGTIDVVLSSGVNAILTNESLITGTGDLTKSGAGNLLLRPGAGNTYSGKTVVSGGQLNITNQNAFGLAPGAFTADQITVENDAMLVAAGNVDLGANRGLTIGAGGARLNVAGGTTLTNYVVTGSDRLISTNTGTNLFLVGNSGTFSGDVLIHAGTVRVGADNALGTGTIYFTNGNNSRLANNDAATPVTLANAIRFDTNAILGQGGTGPLNLTGVMTLAGGQNRNLQVDSAVTNSGGVVSLASEGLIKGGGGVLELTGANSYVGNTRVTNGTLALTGAAGAVTATPDIYVDRARTLQLGAAYGGDNANRIGDALPVTLNGGNLNVLNSTVDVSESFGALVLPSNRSVVTLTPNSGTQIDLNSSSLVRSPGTLLFVRGTNLGSAAGPDTARVTFGTAPTMIGGGGGAGTENISILPYVQVQTNNLNAYGLATFVTHDVNGLRPLTDAEYHTGGLLTAGADENVSLQGAAATTTLVGDRTINSLRVALATGGQTINGAGQTLTITSGGIIVSNAALTVNTRINVGANELIINMPDGAANRVVTFNGPLTGSAGMILDGQNTSDRLDLRGTNSQFSGTIYIHGGQLRLLSPLAVSKNNDLMMSGGFFRLNTNNVEIGTLRGETGTIDNNTVGFSTLTINQAYDARFTGSISNSGTAGSILGVTKNGLGELALGNVNPFTGDFLINQDVVRLNGAGGVSSTNVVINSRGTLILDQGAGNNNNRLRDSGTGIAVRMHGGTLQFTGGGGGASTESMGQLVLESGASSINTARANANQNHTRTFASLLQTPGATINFVDNNLGDDNRNRIVFSAAPTLDDGIIGGWATAGNEFATYVPSGTVSVNLLSTHQTGAETGWVATDNVKMTAATALTAPRTINSLSMTNGGANLNLGGNTLTVDSGGVISTGGSKAITNGTLTTSGNQLYIHVLANNLTNSAVIADGTGGAVQLVKSGTGLLRMTNDNTYTGGTRINQGTFDVNSDLQLGALPGGPDADNIILDGGVLRAFGTTLLDANRGLQLGASGNNAYGILDVSSGTFSILGVISGGTSNPLVARGAGTLVLNNTANTYAGGTIISNSGTLRVLDDGSFGATPAGFDADNIIFDAGTLQFSNSMTLGANRGVVLRGAGGTVGNLNLNVQNAEHVVNINATNVSVGAGATVQMVTKNGAGTLVWTGPAPAAPLWNGRTRIDAGTNSIDHINKLGSEELIVDGGTLRVTSSVDLSSKQVLISTNNNDNGTFTVDAGQTLTYNSVIMNLHTNGVSAGALVKRGDGTLVLGATNLYGGETFVVDGTLSVTVSEALGSMAQGTNVVLVNNESGRNAGMATNLVLRNGTLLLNGTTQTVRQVTLAQNNADTLAGSTAAITGPGRINVLTNITYDGGVGGTAGGAAISADIFLMDLGTQGRGDRTITVADGAATDDLTITGSLTSSLANHRNLTKAGAGTLVLAHATPNVNNWSNTTVTAGTLKLGANEQLPNLRGLEIRNATFDLNGQTETIGALTLGNAAGALPVANLNGGLLINNGTLTYNAGSSPGTALVTGGTYSLGNNNRNFDINDSTGTTEELVITSTITSDNNNRNLTKRFNGTLVLSNSTPDANNFGQFVLNDEGGIVKLGENEQLPNNRTLFIRGTTNVATHVSYFDLNGRTETVGGLNMGQTNTFANSHVRTSELRDDASGGSLILAGNVTYNNGTAGTTFQSGQATISANVNLGAATRTFTVANSTNAAIEMLVSGVISGTGVGLTKAGDGILALTGNNTFTGAATINSGGGVLALAGEGALGTVSAINVNGGTLAISGGGALNRASDTAPVTLNGGAIYLDDTSGGTGFTETLGALTLTANSVIDFGTLNNNSLVLTFGDSDGNAWTAGQFLNIHNWSGTWDSVNGGTAGGPDQLHFDLSGLTAGQLAQIRFFSDSGTTFLGLGRFIGTEVVPTPEPATWVSLGALASLLGWRQRRRLIGSVQRHSR